MDLNPEVEKIFNKPGLMGFCCDVTDDESIRQAVNLCCEEFGGLDVLVSNAGNFPAGLTLEKMTAETWDSSMRLNLSSHQRLLTAATPFCNKAWTVRFSLHPGMFLLPVPEHPPIRWPKQD